MADAGLTRCDQAPGGLCGTVEVPLNRSDPTGPKIPIFFVVFRHTDDSQPPLEPIFVTEGGPGYSVTQNMQAQYQFVFAPLMNRRDLVLIDYRGEGLSAAINCPLLQQGIGVIYDATAQCGEQLGRASDLYGSGDVARDVEAVREALGVERFDYYGGSYAGLDIQAYAVRYPGHLRAAVLDSPVTSLDHDPWWTSYERVAVRSVTLVCARSANCSRAIAEPSAALVWLIHRLRERPLDGTAFDADGNAVHVHVSEAALARFIQFDAGGFVVASELAAAANALRHGDSAPLLRLAAENNTFPFVDFSPGSEAIQFSAGDNVGRFCTDMTFQWNKSAPLATRLAEFQRAKAALAPARFSPFSVDAWTAPPPQGVEPDACIRWPAPTHDPAPPVPPGSTAGSVPALILTGDLDDTVTATDSLKARRVFPNSVAVSLRNSGHHTIFNARGQCARELTVSFFTSLSPGNTSCAGADTFDWPAVGRFPLHAADELPADVAAGHGDASTRLDRRVAAVAAATVTDSLRRAFLGSGTDGVGLRGGSWHGAFTENAFKIRWDAARFAEDVSVSGDGLYAGFTTINANIRIAGVESGQLHIGGAWFDPNTTTLEIRGTLDGRRVALNVPAT